MTVSLVFCVVSKEEKPYIVIAADSLATDEGGANRDEDAKKIFDAGNALMTTSGNVSDEYREGVARFLREHQKDSLKAKIHNVYQENLNFLEIYDFSMVIGLAQFDKEGNPQMSICSISRGNHGVIEPITLDKRTPFATHCYLGEGRTERIEKMRTELDVKINKSNMTPQAVADAAQILINEVSEIAPTRINKNMQTKVIYFKE